MYDIITIGSATRDVFITVDEVKNLKVEDFTAGEAQCFPLGSKLEIKKLVTVSGGGATNTAVTFARQGYKVACASVVGQDNDGKEVKDELLAEKVEIDFIQTHLDDRTGYSVVLVNPNGERTILSYKGEGQHFEGDKFQFEKMGAKWFYLASVGGNFDVLVKLVQAAEKSGAKVAMNPGTKDLELGFEKLKPVMSGTNIFMVNQEEASLLSGIDYKNEKEIFKFMDEAINGIFVMTKGPEGVVVSDGKKIYRAGIPDSPIVDRTGAGDAFGSAFVAGMMRDPSTSSGQVSQDTIEKAIKFATANASAVVAHFGAKEGILRNWDTGPWPLVEVTSETL